VRARVRSGSRTCILVQGKKSLLDVTATGLQCTPVFFSVSIRDIQSGWRPSYNAKIPLAGARRTHLLSVPASGLTLGPASVGFTEFRRGKTGKELLNQNTLKRLDSAPHRMDTVTQPSVTVRNHIYAFAR
jgi:hypothetical protein